MKASQLFIIGAAASTFCACGGNVNVSDASLDFFPASEQDSTVRLQDDFYQFSNGGWIAQHPLPGDRSRFGSFDKLAEEGNDKLKALVEEAMNAKAAKGTPAQKIGDIYALGLDTARRDKEGLEPIKGYLDLVRTADYANAAEFAKIVALMHRAIANPFFAFGSTPDFQNSSMTISELWQAGIGMPDRDYYFKTGETDLENIAAYKVMISKMIAMAGLQNADEKAEAIYNFEKQIAEIMNTRVENRDVPSLCNKINVAKIDSLAPGFDWTTYFKEIGADVEEINVSQLKFFAGIFGVVAKADKEVVKDYLTYKTISGFSSELTSELYAVSFDFYSRKLGGTKEMRPLWKRVLGAVNNCMGEELGKLYVEKYFPATSKQRMVDLVEQLRISFGQRVDNLSWMSDDTKKAAKEKLAAIRVKVGYPDKWKDYSALEIDPVKTYAENMVAVAEFMHKEDMDKLNKPVDKDEWHMTPQTVNAYYNPMGNEIVFPAAILQPPFFYADGDDAVNYGGIGVVIGHEMTHGFDDQGCQFDKEGNLNNWWTEEDSKAFQAASERLVSYFNGLTVVDSVKANGKLTLGENIADLGGLYISHQAFRNTLAGKAEPAPICGQTAEQRFILSYSRLWAASVNKEYLVQQTNTDPHSCGRLRVNAQLPQLDFFYNAFNVKESDQMYMPASERIVIW